MTAAVPDQQALQIAANVLHLARQEKWDAASVELSKIEPLGARAQLTLIYAVTDTALSYQFKARGYGPQEGCAVAPMWMDADDSSVTTHATEVPADVRWVGQFMTARSVMDHDMCHALLTSCSGDAEWSARLNRLVTMCSQMINAFDGATR